MSAGSISARSSGCKASRTIKQTQPSKIVLEDGLLDAAFAGMTTSKLGPALYPAA
jgi:hypothetical protein